MYIIKRQNEANQGRPYYLATYKLQRSGANDLVGLPVEAEASFTADINHTIRYRTKEGAQEILDFLNQGGCALGATVVEVHMVIYDINSEMYMTRYKLKRKKGIESSWDGSIELAMTFTREVIIGKIMDTLNYYEEGDKSHIFNCIARLKEV